MSGDKPWELDDIADELARRFPERGPGPLSADADEDAFVDLAIEVARRAMGRGLLPHSNLGVLSRRSLERLKPWNASMGLMLETVRDDLQAHEGRYRKRLGLPAPAHRRRRRA